MYCVFALLQIPGVQDPFIDYFKVFSTRAKAVEKIDLLAKRKHASFKGELEKLRINNGPVRIVYNEYFIERIYLKEFREPK